MQSEAAPTGRAGAASAFPGPQPEHPDVQTVDTDPNQLLDRPGGYVSRASFDLPGGDPDGEAGTIERGGVIEVFADAAGAKRRADYIADFTTGTPELNGEYNTLRGAVLLRIDHPVAPDVAGRVDAAVAAAAP